MSSIVAGDGGMGRAVAAALAGRGTPPAAILGMPADPLAGHEPGRFLGADLLFDFSQGDAVLPTSARPWPVEIRRFVIGTTNWADDRPEVAGLLVDCEASAVASASFSLGVMLFARSSRSRPAFRSVRRVRPIHRRVATAARRRTAPPAPPWTSRGG